TTRARKTVINHRYGRAYPAIRRRVPDFSFWLAALRSATRERIARWLPLIRSAGIWEWFLSLSKPHNEVNSLHALPYSRKFSRRLRGGRRPARSAVAKGPPRDHAQDRLARNHARPAPRPPFRGKGRHPGAHG